MATKTDNGDLGERISLRQHVIWLVLILVLVLLSIWIVLPSNEGLMIDANNDGELEVNVPLRQSLGLDIVGGLRVLLQAELPAGAFTPEDLQEAANSVSRRVNALGVGEATVQVQGSDR
ncbi:MAG TPA: hypothetical protein VER79_14485, partial [Candidatus Limnocylindrales bacterium]|nr:hypothetical protein [Candidatus Limnocylindrales bacterium]